MSDLVVLAILIGLSIGWAITNYVVQSRRQVDLQAALDTLEAGGSLHGMYTPAATDRIKEMLQNSGPVRRLAPGLDLAEDSPELLAGRLLMSGVWMAAVGVVVSAFLVLGFRVPTSFSWVPIPVLVALGLVGTYQSTLQRIARARQQFRTVLAAYLDVVAVLLGAGLGVETAMRTAIEFSDHWAARRIARTVDTAITTNQPLHTALLQLGTELDDSDLVSLAGAIQRAIDSGASMADTVAQKAKSLRDTLDAEEEAALIKRFEKLFMPAALMSIAFMVILAYPGITALLHGLEHGL